MHRYIGLIAAVASFHIIGTTEVGAEPGRVDARVEHELQRGLGWDTLKSGAASVVDRTGQILNHARDLLPGKPSGGQRIETDNSVPDHFELHETTRREAAERLRQEDMHIESRQAERLPRPMKPQRPELTPRLREEVAAPRVTTHAVPRTEPAVRPELRLDPERIQELEDAMRSLKQGDVLSGPGLSPQELDSIADLDLGELPRSDKIDWEKVKEAHDGDVLNRVRLPPKDELALEALAGELRNIGRLKEAYRNPYNDPLSGHRWDQGTIGLPEDPELRPGHFDDPLSDPWTDPSLFEQPQVLGSKTTTTDTQPAQTRHPVYGDDKVSGEPNASYESVGAFFSYLFGREKPVPASPPLQELLADSVAKPMPWHSWSLSAEETKLLQRQLNTVGNYDLAVDGKPGRNTYAAVIDLQKEHGLKVDGVVGPETLATLVELEAQEQFASASDPLTIEEALARRGIQTRTVPDSEIPAFNKMSQQQYYDQQERRILTQNINHEPTNLIQWWSLLIERDWIKNYNNRLIEQHDEFRRTGENPPPDFTLIDVPGIGLPPELVDFLGPPTNTRWATGFGVSKVVYDIKKGTFGGMSVVTGAGVVGLDKLVREVTTHEDEYLPLPPYKNGIYPGENSPDGFRTGDEQIPNE